jgi:hypothetical protein
VSEGFHQITRFLEVKMTSNLISQVKAILSTTPARWLNLTDTIPIELLSRPPAPGEWSALDCLQHLLDVEQMVFPIRLRALLAGQDFVAFDPDTQGTKDALQTPAQLAARFAQLRAEDLTILEQVTPEDLARTARHSELGQVTMEELLHEWVGHDLMHTVQAEQALIQPFILGSGPWRHYFQDHDFALKKHKVSE